MTKQRRREEQWRQIRGMTGEENDMKTGLRKMEKNGQEERKIGRERERGSIIW